MNEAVARELYEALMAARPHVEVARDHYAALMLTDADAASEVLDRIDGALADAGELLAEGERPE